MIYPKNTYVHPEFHAGIEAAINHQPDWMNPHSTEPESKNFINWYAGWCFQNKEQYLAEKKKREKADRKEYLRSFR
jgi:hypothetical protein